MCRFAPLFHSLRPEITWRAKPVSVAEARARSWQLIRTQQEIIDASHRVTEATAAKQITNGQANGHANGRRAPVIAEDLSQGVIDAVAKGLVQYVKECVLPPLAARDAELEQRINEIETVVRTLVDSVAGRHE